MIYMDMHTHTRTGVALYIMMYFKGKNPNISITDSRKAVKVQQKVGLEIAYCTSSLQTSSDIEHFTLHDTATLVSGVHCKCVRKYTLCCYQICTRTDLKFVFNLQIDL